MPLYEEYFYEIVLALIPIVVAGLLRWSLGQTIYLDDLSTEFLFFPFILVINTILKVEEKRRTKKKEKKEGSSPSLGLDESTITIIFFSLIFTFGGLLLAIAKSVAGEFNIWLALGLIFAFGGGMYKVRGALE